MVKRLTFLALSASILRLVLAPHLAASPADSVSTSAKVRQNDKDKMVGRAVSFLRGQQADDGSYSSVAGPGITSLVACSLLRNGCEVDDPTVEKSLKYLEQFVRPDGGIYQEGTLFRNYETCLAILCFKEANSDGRYDETLERAKQFIMGLQWSEDEPRSGDDFRDGGAGYGKHLRPDLSNTTFFVDALKALETDTNSEAIQNALRFVSACQNLDSEHNKTEFSKRVGDGGFYYTPAAGGKSQAGETEAGGLRSYGSMTYAGLKSMIYAGVGPDDSRVKAAVDWIRNHYTLTENPGMPNGDHGLFYYFHTFAKALDAIGIDSFEDADGTKHDWRAELIDELARRQQADGSWKNRAERWLEKDPNLVTAYCLLALSYCDK